MNKQLVAVARAAIDQARADGMEEDDVLHMAVGACMRYGREQGTIGEDIPREWLAALRALVQQILAGNES